MSDQVKVPGPGTGPGTRGFSGLVGDWPGPGQGRRDRGARIRAERCRHARLQHWMRRDEAHDGERSADEDSWQVARWLSVSARSPHGQQHVPRGRRVRARAVRDQALGGWRASLPAQVQDGGVGRRIDGGDRRLVCRVVEAGRRPDRSGSAIATPSVSTRPGPCRRAGEAAQSFVRAELRYQDPRRAGAEERLRLQREDSSSGGRAQRGQGGARVPA